MTAGLEVNLVALYDTFFTALGMCLKNPSVNDSYGLNWTVYGKTESSHTTILPILVATKACFYFRQEPLIEYDREKMRV